MHIFKVNAFGVPPLLPRIEDAKMGHLRMFPLVTTLHRLEGELSVIVYGTLILARLTVAVAVTLHQG